VDCRPGSEEPDSGQREVLAKDWRARDECDMQDYNLREGTSVGNAIVGCTCDCLNKNVKHGYWKCKNLRNGGV